MIHNQWVIAQPAGLGGIVRHYYYGRFSRGFHAKDDLFNDFSILRVEVCGGFIEAKDLGVDDQGPGDAQTFGFAAGEVQGLLPPLVEQTHALQRLVDPVFNPLAPAAPDF
jgi:hypothetical protein